MTYRFCEPMASGGMAEVFLGLHEPSSGLKRPCILKIIRNELLNDNNYRDMFLDEVKILLHLQHSSIAQFIDFFDKDGSPVLVLEYVQGVTLVELIANLSQQGILLPPVLAMHIMLKIAEALSYIHNFKDPASQETLQIIHRDISPSNILLSFEGDVKLIDFGVAKYTAKSEQTQIGTVKGKPLYMSPEQKRDLELTHKSDIFSFGIVFCEMIRGARFQNENLNSDQDDIQFNLTEIRQISHSDIAELIATCLEIDPASRPEASTIVRILSRYIADYGGGLGAAQLASFLKSRMAKEYGVAKKQLSNVLNSKPTSEVTPSQAPRNFQPDGDKKSQVKITEEQGGISKSLSEMIEASVGNALKAERLHVNSLHGGFTLYKGNDLSMANVPIQVRAKAAGQIAAQKLNQPLGSAPQRNPSQFSQAAQNIQGYNNPRGDLNRWRLSTILLVLISIFVLVISILKNDAIQLILKKSFS